MPLVRHPEGHNPLMAIYYASIGYTSDPDNIQEIPVGGNHPVKFPRNEQRDPWGMHRTGGPVIRMAASGLATFQIDVHWTPGTYARRHYLVSDNQPYEGEADAVRPDFTFTHHAIVRDGEEFAILVGHGSATPQQIAAARIQVMIDDSLADPPEQKIRIREGHDPSVPTPPEGPPTVGDGIPQPPGPDTRH